MTLPPLLALAASGTLHVGRPLFGNLALALVAVSAAIAALLAFVALLGRWLAATHPSPAPVFVADLVATSAARLVATEIAEDVPGEDVPVVLAAVAALYGARGRVASIRRSPPAAPVRAPSLEALMQEWSHEGRRQIYSSHKVR